MPPAFGRRLRRRALHHAGIVGCQGAEPDGTGYVCCAGVEGLATAIQVDDCLVIEVVAEDLVWEGEQVGASGEEGALGGSRWPWGARGRW